MIRLIVTSEELEREVEKLTRELELDEPLYRGLGGISEEEYRESHELRPHEGNMSVGKGVFLTQSLDYARTFAKDTLLITTRRTLDPEQKAIDTRINGYEQGAKEKLDRELGDGKYDGWKLWEEIQKEDTITIESGTPVYTKRERIPQEQIIAEITIQDKNINSYKAERRFE